MRPMKLAKLLKRRRAHLGLTQEEMARRCRVEQPVISGWENGRVIPMFRRFPRISKSYDVTLESLAIALVRS